jgi:hypothetical protein
MTFPNYSEEYDRLRLGIPTSSNFYKIVTSKDVASQGEWCTVVDEVVCYWDLAATAKTEFNDKHAHRVREVIAQQFSSGQSAVAPGRGSSRLL